MLRCDRVCVLIIIADRRSNTVCNAMRGRVRRYERGWGGGEGVRGERGVREGV